MRNMIFASVLCMSLPVAAFPAAMEMDGVMVHEAWARASPGAATNGAAYVSLMGGSKPDSLVGVSTPVAASAEVHLSLTKGGVASMVPVPALAIPPGKMVTLAPGGYHIMLFGLKQPLVAGQTFPVTLTFEHSAPMTVQVQVRPLGAATMGEHDHMQMK